ncbi:MAG: Uma2 family endonuclease [Bacteroidetes bacterium]|nr:Uma2 family endonuclease [Bacteroidota bacterium]
MGNAVKILPHYTYADYLHWEGKWELIDGIPYAMSPAPVPRHQVIAANLISEFRQQLKKCDKCKAYQPIDYLVADDTVFQPDMLIVCGEITKKYLDFPPALVAEILSPSTAAKDRFTKFPVYQDKGIPYYLIIDPDLEEVEIYVLTGGQYKLKSRGRSITSQFYLSDCDIWIDFGEIWQ